MVTSVNMHKLGESFVEKVSDVRRRATVDGKAAAPGESLEFLAHIRGWQSEARRQRRDQLYNWVPVVPVTQGDRENKGVRLQTLAAAASASAPAELAGEAAIWQQMTDEASGKPYWSLTRCVLPDERARFPLPLLPQPPHARAPPAAYTVESRVPAACDRGGARATGTTQRQASPPGPRPRQRTANWW